MNVSAARDWGKAELREGHRDSGRGRRQRRTDRRSDSRLSWVRLRADRTTRRSGEDRGVGLASSLIIRQSPSPGWGIGTEPSRPWRRWLRRARFESALLSPFRSSTRFETILVSRLFERKWGSPNRSQTNSGPSSAAGDPEITTCGKLLLACRWVQAASSRRLTVPDKAHYLLRPCANVEVLVSHATGSIDWFNRKSG